MIRKTRTFRESMSAQNNDEYQVQSTYGVWILIERSYYMKMPQNDQNIWSNQQR